MNFDKFAVFALIALLVLSVNVAAEVNPLVRMENYSFSEYPPRPGDTVLLTLHYVSDSDVCAEKLSVQLSAAYPLAIEGPDTQYAGLLCAESSNNGTFTFKVRVDPLAQTGNYAIAASAVYQKTFLKYTASNSIATRVQGQPDLSATVASSQPVDIYAGDSAVIKLHIYNKGTGYVTSARAAASATGITVKWAGSDLQIGAIAPRSSTDAALVVEASKNLSPGNYPLVLVVNYVAEDGSVGISRFSFDVPVKPRADFSAVDGASVAIGETSLTVVTLENKGSDVARNVKVVIRPVFPYSADGTVRFIDELAPGASVPLDYFVSVDKQALPGKQLLSLNIEYEDAVGKKFSDSADFSLEARYKTIPEIVLGYWYLIVLVIVIAGVYLKRKKK